MMSSFGMRLLLFSRLAECRGRQAGFKSPNP
jgi:hypothetical protein